MSSAEPMAKIRTPEARRNFFSVKPGLNCFCSAISNILQNEGLDYSEAEIFFYSYSLLFRYKNQIGNTDIIHKFSFRSFSSLLNTLQHTIQISFQQIEMPVSMKQLKRLLRYHMFLLDVNTTHLHYFTRIMQYEDFNPPHCIILYDVDCVAEEVHVLDTYVVGNNGEVTTVKTTLSYTDFFQVVNAVFSIDASRAAPPSRDYLRTIFLDNLATYFGGSQSTEINGVDAIGCALTDLYDYPVLASRRYIIQMIQAAFIFRVNFSYINEYLLNIFVKIIEGVPENIQKQISLLKSKWLNLYCHMIRSAYLQSEDAHKNVMAQMTDTIKTQHMLLREILAFFQPAQGSYHR